MFPWLDPLLQWLLAAPDLVLYLVLAFAAALENVLPPIPADVVVLFGGVLAGRGVVHPWTVFVAVWIANVAGASLVYWIGWRYGPTFFTGRWGRLLLRPQQLTALSAFYQRYGFAVIFVSRFLPMFRAVVPVFAGVARLGFWRTALPMAVASGLWYGFLVYVGTVTGRNWEQVVEMLGRAGRWLWVLALLALAVVGWWWWTTRRDSAREER